MQRRLTEPYAEHLQRRPRLHEWRHSKLHDSLCPSSGLAPPARPAPRPHLPGHAHGGRKEACSAPATWPPAYSPAVRTSMMRGELGSSL